MPSRIKQSPRKQRDRRGELLRRLGVDDSQLRSHPSILYHLRVAGVSNARLIDILRADGDDEESQQFISAWDSLTPADQRIAGLDVVAIAAGLTPRRLWELFSGAVLVQSKESISVMIALNLPDVMRTTIRRAKQNDAMGASAREHLFKAAGVLPTPKGSTTTINLGQPSLPPPDDDEDDDLTVPDANQFYKTLHAAPVAPALPASTEPSQS